MADLVPVLVRLGGQATQALACPAQRRHRIAARVRLDKRVQIVEQSAIRLRQRFPPDSPAANAPPRQRLRRLEIFQSTPDCARGDARNARHCRKPAMAGGLGLTRRRKDADDVHPDAAASPPGARRANLRQSSRNATTPRDRRESRICLLENPIQLFPDEPLAKFAFD
jgi:hypothetical protein